MSLISLLTICLAAVSLVVAAKTSTHFGLVGKSSGHFETQVVNGNIASRTQFPWHAIVFVQRPSSSWIFCAGAVLSRNTVLTHADCLVIGDPTHVQLGSSNFNSGQREEVSRYTVHPRFNSKTNRNKLFNIAVLKLKHQVHFTSSISPIGLPQQKFKFYAFQNLMTRFAGFGTNSSHHPSKQLRWTNLRVQTIANCSAAFPLPKNSEHMLLCTEKAGKSHSHPGYGDIGGPLVWKYQNRYYVIGMFARVQDAADLSKGPAGFINIAAHAGWIWSVVKDSGFNPDTPPTPPKPKTLDQDLRP